MATLTSRSRASSIVADADGLVTTFVIVPPDGGWGWVVVAAAFFVQMLFGATLFSVSELIETVAEDFHVTMAEASVYSSLFGGCTLCIGPVVSAMAHKYGFRTVTTVGAVIGTLGFVGASFADSLPVLIFSFGFLGGIGYGMLFVPSIIVAVFYFDRWRALVQGITVCGSSVGGSIAPPIINLAVKTLGWRYTILVEAGMLLSCGLASLLYVPLKPVMKRVTPTEMSHAVRNGASRTHQVRARCDVTLWTSPSYLMFGVSCILCMVCVMTPFVYLPDRSRRLGVEASTVDLLIPVANAFSTVGRLVCGALASSSPRPISTHIVGSTIFASGAAHCLSGLSADSAFQLVCAMLFGLFLAAFNALRVVILVELIGLERLTTAFGYLLFTQGCSVMVGAPIAGMVKELTGDYDSVFWLTGGLMLASSLFIFPLPCINRWEKARAMNRRDSSAMTSTATPSSGVPSFEPDADGLVTTHVTVPPDGGWGWVVLLAAFVVQIQFGATMLVVSSLVGAVAVDFQIPMSQASIFSSLFGGCAYCIGPVVSAMAHKYGFRTVTSIGAVIGTLGFVGGSFAGNITVLVLTYGILGGIGFGMIFMPSIIVAVFYFDRWRALVQGITVCGTSVGGSIAPPLFGLAVKRLGWRYTILIEACMLVSCGLVSLLYVPLKPVVKRLTPAEMALVVRQRASRSQRANVLCDFSLFRSPSFLMFGVSGIFAMTCLMVPFVYWPDRSRKMGVDETTVEMLVPSCNIASLFGRLACGVLASYPWPVALPIFNVTLVTAGLALCLSFLSSNAVFQIAVAVCYGLHQASFNALRAVILVELIGLERLTHAVGLLLFTQGVSIMIGPPLAGEINILTGNYDSVFWLAGGLLLVGSLFVLPLSCVNRWEKRRARAVWTAP